MKSGKVIDQSKYVCGREKKPLIWISGKLESENPLYIESYFDLILSPMVVDKSLAPLAAAPVAPNNGESRPPLMA